MADYKMYLASSILTEDKVITYRLLSRALKVHVNVAKEMLYDFHQKQNAKKPGMIHATYLLSGTKKMEDPISLNGETKKDGEDDYMLSSPFMSSSMPQPEEGTGESSVLSITLVREEDLEEVRSQYEDISSIHIYSLEPHPLKDLQVLSDATRELQLLTANEDPLKTAEQYGTIINKNVKRRTARRPPPTVVALATSTSKASATSKSQALAPAVQPKPEPKSQPSTANDFFGKGKEKTKAAAGSNASSKESTPAPGPAALKKESSSIFKSFAKAKPKLKREETDSPVVEDSPMRDVDDEDEEETYVPPVQSKEIVESDRKARKEREENLRRMMEEAEDSEAMEVAEKPEKEVTKKEQSVEPEKETSVISGGRRRGRRRVMKKKTVKDAEGYLVTKEEPVWESFSEDEAPPPPKAKAAATFNAKGKRSTAKAGQGNIMAFFGKK